MFRLVESGNGFGFLGLLAQGLGGGIMNQLIFQVVPGLLFIAVEVVDVPEWRLVLLWLELLEVTFCFEMVVEFFYVAFQQLR
jgi:hypothetical protein